MNDLLDAYSGKGASGYDERRSKSTRWKNEISAFASMLSNTKATRVLDCPFGTGRWIPQYSEHGLNVTAIDISAGMLAEATNKIESLPKDKQDLFTLREQSIFDLDPANETEQPDLIVCIRFLNWISFSEVEKVIGLLTAYGTEEMIIGASVVPRSATSLRRLWDRWWLNLINFQRPGRPKQFVHDEGRLLELLELNGWRVAEQEFIMKSKARTNYFYRLIRSGGGN